MKIQIFALTGLLILNIAWSAEGDVNINAPMPKTEVHSGRDTVEVIIGSPYTGNVIPFWGASYNASRFQVLFLQSEINTTGDIIKFAFMPWSAGNVTCNYYNVKVDFCHTPVTQLSSTFDNNYGGNAPVQVLSKDTLLVGGPQNTWIDWEVIFPYNNTDNLLVEIKWNGDAGTNIALWRTSESVPRRLYAWDDNASTGTLQNTGNHVRLTIVTNTGTEEILIPEDRSKTTLQVMPNLITSSTTIKYTVNDVSDVKIDICDALGRSVSQLVHSRHAPGSYDLQWDGMDNNGTAVGNGVYFCRLAADCCMTVTPVILMK